MCFGPSTLGAGAKTRLESRIKKFTPHCVCRYWTLQNSWGYGNVKFLDLGCAPYVLYGGKYIGLVSPMTHHVDSARPGHGNLKFDHRAFFFSLNLSWKIACKKHQDLRCVLVPAPKGPGTLGARAKTRLESGIKKFTPHCFYCISRPDWGENGYFRMLRDADTMRTCSITSWVNTALPLITGGISYNQTLTTEAPGGDGGGAGAASSVAAMAATVAMAAVATALAM